MKKKVMQNIIALYGLSAAKMIFPLLTLPYLTRVLSIDTYGVVSYIKTLMTYFQVFVDFGFLLSGTKDIVNAKDNLIDLGKEVGHILLARITLACVGFFALIFVSLNIPILKEHKIYTLLAFIPIFLSIFLFDFVFRGLEKMHIITIRFFLMKSISTLLTFVFVKTDSDIIWIPLLDILSSVVAITLVIYQLKRFHIHICITNLSKSIDKLKQSFIYFFSNMAATIFSALTTVIIGFFLSKANIAYWSLCIQIIATIQALYSPIIDGVYPSMVKTKEIRQIKNLLYMVMPIITVGCILTYIFSKTALLIVGGVKYENAFIILRLLIPVLFLGFPAMLLGWPTLGAINKEKNVTYSTVISAVFQIIGLFVLILFNQFSLIYIAIVRSCTEFVLFLFRLFFCYKNRNCFH